MSDLAFKVPREFRRGGKAGKEAESVESGGQLIQLMCRRLNLPDLGNSSVLDIGCGSKLVQAILDDKLSIGRYVGIDVAPKLIDFLQKSVTDPRFTFHVSNSHNEMYNPEGEPLSADSHLPVEEASFDIICLFSVFTHLAPHDYVAMLQMLRRYIKPGGKIIFSLFLNETTKGGLSFIDGVTRAWGANAQHSSKFQAALRDKLEAVHEKGELDFLDYDKSQPLKWAIYARSNALRLMQETGWAVDSLNDPEGYIQHYMICSPV
jgi:SAM-dependent methyltransferase